MKKIFLILLVGVITVISISKTYGQLSDTLIIGSAPSDFLSFSTAVSALNSQGINGNVVFKIKPGTYSEQISINQISGAGPAATITFQPQNDDSTSVILEFASSSNSTNNYVIQLNGADYITFDKLTIKRTDTLKYCKVIDFFGSAKRNTISNCILEGNVNLSNTQIISAVIASNNTGYKSNNTFQNNVIKNGSIGLYFTGQSSTTPDSNILISNNNFINQSTKGIYIQSHRFAYINGNNITNNTSNNTYNAIYLQYSNDTMRILKNKISLTTGYGICIWNCNESTSTNSLIANNFISVGGTSTAIGLYLFNSKYQYILHNSVNIVNSVPVQGSCININGSTSQYIYVKNNIFNNSAGGYAYYVSETTSATPISESDYNDFYVGSGVNIGWWRASHGISNIAIWRTTTSLDMNSIVANPNYVSITDLHATSNIINGAATPILTPFVISTDIDSDTRDANTPDIGADEFFLENLGVSFIELPPSGYYCQNESFHVKVHIKNYGLYAFSGTIPLFYKIGNNSAVHETSSNVTIPSGDSLTFTFTSSEAIPVTGYFTLSSGTNMVADNDHSNDSLTCQVQVRSIPLAGFTYLPNDLEISFTNTSLDADTYYWDFGDSTYSTDTNPAHIYSDYDSYTVILEIHNGCGTDSYSQLITVAGIDNLKEEYGVAFYPNPVTEHLHLELGEDSKDILSISIYSAEGKLIRTIQNESKRNISIDLSLLPDAFYFISVQTEEKVFFQKIMKMK